MQICDVNVMYSGYGPYFGKSGVKGFQNQLTASSAMHAKMFLQEMVNC